MFILMGLIQLYAALISEAVVCRGTVWDCVILKVVNILSTEGKLIPWLVIIFAQRDGITPRCWLFLYILNVNTFTVVTVVIKSSLQTYLVAIFWNCNNKKATKRHSHGQLSVFFYLSTSAIIANNHRGMQGIVTSQQGNQSKHCTVTPPHHHYSPVGFDRFTYLLTLWMWPVLIC